MMSKWISSVVCDVYGNGIGDVPTYLDVGCGMLTGELGTRIQTHSLPSKLPQHTHRHNHSLVTQISVN